MEVVFLTFILILSIFLGLIISSIITFDPYDLKASVICLPKKPLPPVRIMFLFFKSLYTFDFFD